MKLICQRTSEDLKQISILFGFHIEMTFNAIEMLWLFQGTAAFVSLCYLFH